MPQIPEDVSQLSIVTTMDGRCMASTSRKHPRQKDWFLKGPIPGPWIERAASLPGKALHVAMALQHQSALAKSKQVKVGKKLQVKFGLKSDSYLRGLRQLEGAGLVRVSSRPGNLHQITIQDTPLEQSN